jgi:malate dehydrogenase
LPCAAFLEGEYGINGLYAGVPVKLGAKGIEEIIEVELTKDESAALNASAESVQELVDIMAKA